MSRNDRVRIGDSRFNRPVRPELLPAAAPAQRREAATPPPTADPHGPVCLASPFAYVAEGGAMRGWHAGQVVTDPAEAAELMRRGAPVLPLGPRPFAAGSAAGDAAGEGEP